MKKLRALFIGIVSIILILLLGSYELNKSTGQSGDKVLNIYNWGDYIDPTLITKFEKETGYKVNYETFDSNEAMYTKIQQGGTDYDITVPSDYMVEKMRKAHMLTRLDKSKLPNLKYIGKSYLNKSFDPNNSYSVPYFWGTLGIVYNDKYYKESDVDTWGKLWSSKFHDQIMFIDGAREFMGIGLSSLGYSLNSTNAQHVEQAYKKLKKLTPNAKAIVSDEIKMYMINGESNIAVTYSGEAVDMLAKNKHLHYVIPKEGTNLWFDNIVIPKNAKNKKGAYAFINFMLRPENAAKNAEYVGYSTPNEGALKLLPKSVTADKQFYPTKKQLQTMEVYKNLGTKWLEKYNDLFLELKMYHK
ncbi:ABC transporter substrate-binding protein [Ligilactobacillus sp. WILCCON 0076]|uniref:ABC transporter substrate-binding protein n=1 Tax=Ligilactobacillus ubinensis TaxID=2876789 RepID=A0A9X2FJ95_9LACO|nr:ABC transporter substrate-binding protein [Ligilactobacillus ubinensis]MCP0885876.1 ABC transporter substrate-binding protein [Ligilactobacillus ubinensis]